MGSFFPCPRVPHALPASPLRTPLLSEPGEKVAHPQVKPLRSALLIAPRHHRRDCAVKAPGELGLQCRPGSYPSCPARSELRPTDSRPKRARSPLPFSPLASSSFCARRGRGGDESGGDASQPPPPGGGGRAESARGRQPLLPFAPALRICPCSRRSCCRCLGGRLRVT